MPSERDKMRSAIVASFLSCIVLGVGCKVERGGGAGVIGGSIDYSNDPNVIYTAPAPEFKFASEVNSAADVENGVNNE